MDKKHKRKLLVICGPTATGKTNLAIHLSSLFDAELISADSRQVYKGMDIGTGKDKPPNQVIWGYDLVEPTESFSVSQYQEIIRLKIEETWNLGKLPILVGGSGLYIKAIVDGIQTVHVPPNVSLREAYASKSAFELFTLLVKLSPIKAKQMNISDRNNPRRLLRAIEIASAIDTNIYLNEDDDFVQDSLFIGLNIDSNSLRKKITSRVEKRIKDGMEEEVESLVRKGVSWESQALNSLGYKYWKDYFQGIINLKELKKLWITDEYQYAKRQMTWFKRDQRIHWFDATLTDFVLEVEALVKRWHNSEIRYAKKSRNFS